KFLYPGRVRPFQGSPSNYIMWAGVVTGKNLRASNERKKHENTNDRNPRGCTGYDRFGTRIQSTDWSAKTGARDGDTASSLKRSRGHRSCPARIQRRPQPAPDAQSMGARALRHLGGKHSIRSEPPRKMERY